MIRIGREMQCLPYVGFFMYSLMYWLSPHTPLLMNQPCLKSSAPHNLQGGRACLNIPAMHCNVPQITALD